jgi:hypothetical protein
MPLFQDVKFESTRVEGLETLPGKTFHNQPQEVCDKNKWMNHIETKTIFKVKK